MLMAYHPQSIHESLYESLFQLSILQQIWKKHSRKTLKLQSLPEEVGIFIRFFHHSSFQGIPDPVATNKPMVKNPSKKTRGLGIGWSGTVSAGSAPLYTNGVVVGITLRETNSSHLKMDGWNTILSFFQERTKECITWDSICGLSLEIFMCS